MPGKCGLQSSMIRHGLAAGERGREAGSVKKKGGNVKSEKMKYRNTYATVDALEVCINKDTTTDTAVMDLIPTVAFIKIVMLVNALLGCQLGHALHYCAVLAEADRNI